jgi:hypothetical protein
VNEGGYGFYLTREGGIDMKKCINGFEGYII